MMSAETTTSVKMLTATRLATRQNLVFTPQISAGQIDYYLVEDPVHGRFFRLGQIEYAFVSCLDGQLTIEEAFADLSKHFPNHGLTEADTIGLCKWLVDMDLAQSVGSTEADRLLRRAKHVHSNKLRANTNPLAFRIPLFKPDRLLNWWIARCRFLFSPWAAFAWVAFVCLGLGKILLNWDRFVASSQGVFEVGNWLWLLGCWAILKLLHEAAHGLACKFYGGSVREAGIQCLWLMPLPYVDVTSSWRFRERGQRIGVAAAGMIAEFWIAAMAAIVWSQTEPSWINHLAYNDVWMASLSTLLFNMNPLMKLDGYYILSDAVGIPNLYSHGQRRVRDFFDRYWFGISTRSPSRSTWNALFILGYGWLSLLWRILICVSLTLAVSRYFGHASLLVISAVLVLWLGPICLRFVHFLFLGRPGCEPRRIRILVIGSTVVVATSCFLVWTPWFGKSRAPAIVDYAPPILIRSAGSGRVKQVLVERGQLVAMNELLLIQENPELATKIASLKLQIQQSEIRERRFQQKGQVASQQSEAEQREALSVELKEKQDESSQLEIRSPQAGRIIHRDLSRLIGTYLKAGDEVMSLADESKKEIRISIAQNDFDIFKQRVGNPVTVDVPGQPLIEGRLEKIVPRASLTPIHAALTTVNGGTLPVRPNRDRAEATKGFELLSPRLEGVVSIAENHCPQLFSGQRAVISYRACQESIGQHLFCLVERAIRLESQSRSAD